MGDKSRRREVGRSVEGTFRLYTETLNVWAKLLQHLFLVINFTTKTGLYLYYHSTLVHYKNIIIVNMVEGIDRDGEREGAGGRGRGREWVMEVP